MCKSCCNYSNYSLDCLRDNKVFSVFIMIRYIKSQEELVGCIDYLWTLDEICLDSETSGFCPYVNKLLLLQLGDFNVQYVINCPTVDLYPLKEVLESKLCIIQNAQFDLRFILSEDINIKNVYDTFLAECILYTGYNFSEKDKPFFVPTSLDALAIKYCNVQLDKSIRGKIHKGITQEVIEYAADDIKYLSAIKSKQLELIYENKLERVLELENKAVVVLSKMIYTGINFDSSKIREVIDELEVINKDLTVKLDSIITEESATNNSLRKYTQVQQDLFNDSRLTNVNWASNAQKTDILNRLNVKVTSVADKVLQFNKTKHRIIPLLIDFSKYAKLYSSFGPTLSNFINPISGRIHSSIWQILSTGRISMKEPNLQQIPSHSSLGRKIKSCFIASEGYKLVSADLSGMELRIIAHYSGDPLWVRTFIEGGDLHSILCAETFNIHIEDVKKPFPPKPDITYRFLQKTLNFGLAYGMSKFKLAETAQISIPEADKIINDFFNKVPKVEEFLNLIASTGVRNGFIRTNPYYKRKRYFPSLNKEDNSTKGAIERASKNSVPQGTNADIIKQTLINLQEVIDINNYPARLLLSIHDEVISECKEEYAEEWKFILERVMIDTAEKVITSIPIKVDAIISDYWTD